ncbi:MAG TPA: SMP-30/gluconolactonase/LRE family protein [Streptosporangiaceae bacterium]|nr:SMP-30/gluconolactonase/LRE family protein [Streptosporangiaceae bacterium]
MNVSWDVAVPARAELGERPFWDDAVGALMWVDILAGHLHRYRPGEGDSVFHTAGVAVGAAGPRAGGGYVLAAADGFRLVDAAGQPAGGPWRPRGMLADVRFNDGACDPAGRFWAGTVAADRRPGAGALYRLDPGGQISVLLDGVTESNGLGWSPDGGTFYYIDSGEPQPRIRAFPCDLAAGTLGRPRDLVQPPASYGIPDGLVVDTGGGLWVAFWGGGAVRRYSAAGELLAELPVPVSQPSCPAFGGPGLEDLYLTTAWENMTEAQRAAEPLAGNVLHTRAGGVAGQPAGRFGG